MHRYVFFSAGYLTFLSPPRILPKYFCLFCATLDGQIFSCCDRVGRGGGRGGGGGEGEERGGGASDICEL